MMKNVLDKIEKCIFEFVCTNREAWISYDVFGDGNSYGRKNWTSQEFFEYQKTGNFMSKDTIYNRRKELFDTHKLEDAIINLNSITNKLRFEKKTHHFLFSLEKYIEEYLDINKKKHNDISNHSSQLNLDFTYTDEDYDLNQKPESTSLYYSDNNLFGWDNDKGHSHNDFLSVSFLFHFFLFFFKYKKLLKEEFYLKISTDKYGNSVKDAWLNEINYFLVNTIFRDALCTFEGDEIDFKDYIQLTNKAKSTVKTPFEKEIRALIISLQDFFFWCSKTLFEDNKIINEPQKKETNLQKGINFEEDCIKILSLKGWSCKNTKKSFDKGADIIANKGPLKIVFQCKNHNEPVGISSIQQAYSAKKVFNSNLAAVISNSGFTNAAIEMGKNTDVMLLSFDDLGNL